MKLVASFAIALVGALCSVAVPVEAARHKQATIDILAYNDVYEMLQDDMNGVKLGGPSRVVPLAREMREKNANSLVIFAGDTMSPSLWSSQFKGRQMIDAHNAIGVDVACLGNHEFDFGIEGFLNASEASNFPWLNANCYEQDTGALLHNTQPNLVKTFDHPEFGRVKIGFFGVMYDMKDKSKGVYWTDPLEAAKQQVKFLREHEKVDMVIALTHQDLADDNRMSKDVKGIDLIYGGHDHSSMLQTSYGTPYLKAEMNFRSVWSSTIEFFPAEGKMPASTRMKHTAIPIIEELPTDAALDATIANYSATIQELFKREVGSLCEPLDLGKNMVRVQDCAIGNIFADAAVQFYGPGQADVAVSNGGGIRGDKVLPAGPITLGEIVSWSPFSNTVMVTETTGAGLKKFITAQMVNNCGAGMVVPNGNYVHPAGIKYVFKCSGQNAGELTTLEWQKHPSRTGPVKDDDSVKLALNNYWYVSGIVPLGVPSKVLKSDAEGGRIDASLEQYVLTFPDKNLCVKADGRSLVTF
ncbi:TPA: hypothetical protein N0F65_009624 [Lagenidium giganteum]|uniref:5'-nucleotidase n=1 Tax=Lagenidium giganteum TaxID=4803 RepID=A0AAV2YUE6_9STRA|nr:TPA: hypothetical protein N0F65_009624 [Lagenidium giganteum]